jgi:AraC-like DNA-binding protein
MRIGTRTLQRRLEESGTTFSALRQDVLRDQVERWVSDAAIPLSEIAERAGFSDAATFGRAFKRWTGLAPGAYRNAHRG